MFSSFFGWLSAWLVRYWSRWQKTPAQQSSQLLEQEETSSINTAAFKKNPEKETVREIEKEIRSGRKFSIAEAIGREGGSFMKGESVVPRPLRAANEIKQFIAAYSSEPTGVLASELYLWVTADIRVSAQLDTPLVAFAQIVETLLDEPTFFYEFARQVAIAHSRLTGDRPYFQQPNHPPHPEADYTHDAIRQYLSEISTALSLYPFNA
ncbi:MAG: hypothetical protein AAF716_18455 [Cyanobacteria bacterium P01_D01_bin.1]